MRFVQLCLAIALATCLVDARSTGAQVVAHNGRLLSPPSDYTVFYLSAATCNNLQKSWDEYTAAVREEHQACLDAHHTTGTGDRVCSVAACRQLHDEMNSRKGPDAVSECRDRLLEQEQKAREVEQSKSAHKYDEIVDVVDKAKDGADELAPDTPANKLAQKVRDASLDKIHKRNRETLSELDKLDKATEELGQGTSGTSHSSDRNRSTLHVPDTSERPYAELEIAAMTETDPGKLRRLIAEYERRTDSANCGRPCFKVLDAMRRRLRAID